MKRLLLRLVVVLLSFGIGVSVALLFTAYRSNKSDSPAVNSSVSSRCPSASELILKGKYVVIAIPSEDEFYIGKNKVSLSEIPDRVRTLVGNELSDERIVFIKGQPNVKYETVSSVIERIKEADVSRIEIVPNKKKVSEQ